MMHHAVQVCVPSMRASNLFVVGRFVELVILLRELLWRIGNRTSLIARQHKVGVLFASNVLFRTVCLCVVPGNCIAEPREYSIAQTELLGFNVV